ncbi:MULTISPECIES: hypothetical protein [unclassified Psychrobacter]|jgi:hypothetical protein|uniref:hypothetical protein n=1 Tax=unclassified Psychrobacter TaxID=196806 RepID=UPI00188BE0B3|nr:MULTISPECIES: hypothetical protein [unclassified Psychrobacter]MBF4488345.1 hypothetical protein [Psychrobacter sp. N25K4-3-2]MBH0065192.1 hypothetical protein [Psychrobacter sp. SZ93C1]
MNKHNLNYENFKKINAALPVIRLEENYGESLINCIYRSTSLDIDDFFLSCLKEWIVNNFYHEDTFEEDVNEYLSSINIVQEVDIDFSKRVSNVSMQRSDYFIKDLKSIEIDFSTAKQYITYIDGPYEHLGILQTAGGFYAFFMYMG